MSRLADLPTACHVCSLEIDGERMLSVEKHAEEARTKIEMARGAERIKEASRSVTVTGAVCAGCGTGFCDGVPSRKDDRSGLAHFSELGGKAGFFRTSDPDCPVCGTTLAARILVVTDRSEVGEQRRRQQKRMEEILAPIEPFFDVGEMDAMAVELETVWKAWKRADDIIDNAHDGGYIAEPPVFEEKKRCDRRVSEIRARLAARGGEELVEAALVYFRTKLLKEPATYVKSRFRG